MTKQSVNTFLQAAGTNPTLSKQIEAASEPAIVVQIAANNGYEFTEEELVNSLKEQQIEFAKEELNFSESAIALFEEAQENEALREQLDAAVNSANTTAEVMRIAQEKGFTLTEEEITKFLQAQQEPEDGELSEEALEAVAGGGWCFKLKWPRPRPSSW